LFCENHHTEKSVLDLRAFKENAKFPLFALVLSKFVDCVTLTALDEIEEDSAIIAALILSTNARFFQNSTNGFNTKLIFALKNFLKCVLKK
jgi:hypothetical protein